MTSVCPAGHTSSSDDYCDVCGMPIEQSAVDSAAPAAASQPSGASAAPSPAGTGAGPVPDGQPCPNCGTPNVVDALFCEACGYDFTTGTMPRPVTAPGPTTTPAGPGEAVPPGASTAPPGQNAEASPPPASAPGNAAPFDWVVEVWIDPAWYEAQESPDPMPSPGLPVVVPLRARSVLVGRTSASRNIHPEIDCETDSGVSRRQAQLTTDGTRWWVEDLESANGTFIGAAAGAVPEDPIPVGIKRELNPDDRVYVGAWTRLVIRQATDEEKATLVA
jgi:hypothetical protein